MKTAVSIPDDIFKETDRIARRSKRSRSEIVSRALAEYIARHSSDRVTEDMNQAVDAVNGEDDRFAATAARRTLRNTEW